VGERAVGEELRELAALTAHAQGGEARRSCACGQGLSRSARSSLEYTWAYSGEGRALTVVAEDNTQSKAN
jgi:hypothetical protein